MRPERLKCLVGTSAFTVTGLGPDGSLRLSTARPEKLVFERHVPRQEHAADRSARRRAGTAATATADHPGVATPVDPGDATTAIPLRLADTDAAFSAQDVTACPTAVFVQGNVAPVELDPPFTVTLTDLTPSTGQTEPNGEVGVDGIHGHRIGSTVRLKLDITDASGLEPTYPVFVSLALGGARHGSLSMGGPACDRLAFIWHERDAEGTLINPNDEVDLTLGTAAAYVGAIPDEASPGHVTPVWGATEVLALEVKAAVPGEEGNPLLRTYKAHPEPGKPDHFACWEWTGGPCGDVFRFFPGYKEGRTISDAYHLEDAHGNTVFGYTATSLTPPGGNVALSFTEQTTTGPDFASYGLGLWWSHNPAPSPSLTSTLTVSYPDDIADPPDWPAGTVSQDITLELDTASTYVLMPKQGYDGRFGVVDGDMPVAVAPGAGEGGLPQTSDGSTPRLVLLAIAGTWLPSPMVTGLVEPSTDPNRLYHPSSPDWIREWAGDQDARLVTEPGGRFELMLVDYYGRRAEGAAFRVHLCPRAEHLTEDAPPEPCTALPVESEKDGEGHETGMLASIDLNAPGAARGYLGIELTKAPVNPGMYVVNVRSIGPTPYRINATAYLLSRSTPESLLDGAYPICTVSGVEILDQNFQRVNPIEVTETVPAYVRTALPGSTAMSLDYLIRTEREDGTIVTPNAAVVLARLGASGVYVGEVSLVPEGGEGESGTAVRGLRSLAPSLTVGLGPNLAVVSSAQGQPLTRCKVSDPAVLRFRFVKRDGGELTESPDPGHPELAGTVQETEIGDSSNSYAEIIDLEIQAVDRLDPTRICYYCVSLPKDPIEVGIKEDPNANYNSDTEEFFSNKNQANGGTRLESSGKINGVYAKLDAGIARVQVKAVVESRRRVDTSGPGDPWPPLRPGQGTAVYASEWAPILTAVPARGEKRVKPGSTQTVGLWVDERTYVHERGHEGWWRPNLETSLDEPNSARDWLEKKLRDLYATWTGNDEIVDGMSRLGIIKDTNEDMDYTALATPGQANLGCISTGDIDWKLSARCVRRDPTASELGTFGFDQAGLQVDAVAQCFTQLAVHEARHLWQHTLTASVNAYDPDLDGFPLAPPSSASVLRDARFDRTGVAGNPEFDFYHPGIPDLGAWALTGTNGGTAAKEADAIRVSSALFGSPAQCLPAASYGLSLAQRSVTGGEEVAATVTWRDRQQGAAQDYDGVTVIFEVVSGNMRLSELVSDLYPIPGTPPTGEWVDRGDPTSVVDYHTVLRLEDNPLNYRSCRARYASAPNDGPTEARVLVLPPADGVTPAATRIKATLVVPKSECGALTIDDTINVTP